MMPRFPDPKTSEAQPFNCAIHALLIGMGVKFARPSYRSVGQRCCSRDRAEMPTGRNRLTKSGISKRRAKAVTMAGSHGSAEATNASAASIKSASQTVLGSALGTVLPINIPASASKYASKAFAKMSKTTPAAATPGSSGRTAAIPLAKHRSVRTELQPYCAQSLRDG